MSMNEKAKSIKKDDVTKFLVDYGIYLVMGLLILIVIGMEPGFLSMSVFINILSQSSVKLILALGVGGIIVLQGTDLSLGRIVGFATVIAASLLQALDAANKFYPELFLNTTPAAVRLLVTLLICIVVCSIFTAINGSIRCNTRYKFSCLRSKHTLLQLRWWTANW